MATSQLNFQLTNINRHLALDTILDSKDVELPILFNEQVTLMESLKYDGNNCRQIRLTKGLFSNGSVESLQHRRRTKSEAVVNNRVTRIKFKTDRVEKCESDQIIENEANFEPKSKCSEDNASWKLPSRSRSKSEVLPFTLEYRKLALEWGFNLVPLELSRQILDPFGDLPKLPSRKVSKVGEGNADDGVDLDFETGLVAESKPCTNQLELQNQALELESIYHCNSFKGSDDSQLNTVIWSEPELTATSTTNSNGEPISYQLRYSKLGFQFNPTLKQAALPPVESPKFVMGGSVIHLIQILTSQIDYTFMSDFFLTYRLFLTKSSLIRLLMGRYRSSLTTDTESNQIVRVRMFVVLRHWLINYFQIDFSTDAKLRKSLATHLVHLETIPNLSSRDRRILKEIRSIMVRLTPSSTSYYLVVTPLDEANQFWGANLGFDLESNQDRIQLTPFQSHQLNSNANSNPNLEYNTHLRRSSEILNGWEEYSSFTTKKTSVPSLLLEDGSNRVNSTSLIDSKSSNELIGINQSRSLELKSPLSVHHSNSTGSILLPQSNSNHDLNSSFSGNRARKVSSWNLIKVLFNKENEPTTTTLHPDDSITYNSKNNNNKVRKFSSLNKLLKPKPKPTILTQTNNHNNTMCMPIVNPSNKVETLMINESLKRPADPPLSRYAILGQIDHVPLPEHLSNLPTTTPLTKDEFTTANFNGMGFDLDKAKYSLHKFNLNFNFQHPFKSNSISFVLDYPSELLAQQFSVIEANLLRQVKWQGLVTKFFKLKGATNSETDVGVNENSNEDNDIDKLVKRFNQVCEFIIQTITTTRLIENQVQLLEKFIRIGYKCYLLNNFATLTQILLALQSPTVSQLGMAWSLVSTEEHKSLSKLVQFSNPFHNWKTLRSTMKDLAEKYGEVNDTINNPNGMNTKDGIGSNNCGRNKKFTSFSFFNKSATSPNRNSNLIDNDIFLNNGNDRLNTSDCGHFNGCIPFMGLYLSDLLHLTELPDLIVPKPNSTTNNNPNGGSKESVPNPQLTNLTNKFKNRPTSLPSPLNFNDFNPKKSNESNPVHSNLSCNPSSLKQTSETIIQLFPNPPKNLAGLEHPTAMRDAKIINFHKFRQISTILKRFLTFQRLANHFLIQFQPHPNLLRLCTELV